jgi:hypothetical protein
VSSEEQFRTLLAPLKERDVVLRVKHQTQVTFVAGTLDVDPETAMAQIQFVSAPPDAESKDQQTQSKDGVLETEVLVADSAKLFASPLNLDGPPLQNPADDEPGFCLAATAVSTKSAQRKAVPPPPKPADEGPSLEVTMKFIQDKLNQEGSVSYIESYHNSITGEQGGPWKHSFASSVEEVYPSGGLSLKTVHAWPMAGHRDTFTHRLCFKEVEKLEVLSMAEYANREATRKGNPELVYQYDPPAYELLIHMTSGKTLPTHVQRVKGDSTPIEETEESTAEIDLPFPDEDTANRLAKAMVHAVELCGGGSKPEPF